MNHQASIKQVLIMAMADVQATMNHLEPDMQTVVLQMLLHIHMDKACSIVLGDDWREAPKPKK